MKYQVTLTVGATISVEVEAESEEEAKAKAFEEASDPSLCHQCASHVEMGGVLQAIAAYPAD